MQFLSGLPTWDTRSHTLWFSVSSLEVMEGDELWELASWPSGGNSQKRLTQFVSDTVFHILITKCKPSSHLSI